MNLSTRDKWLLAILPAILTVMAYFFLQAGPAQRNLAAALAQLDKERAAPTSARALATAGAERDRVEDALLAAREKAHQLSTAQPTGVHLPAEERGQALRTISDAMSAQGLFLVQSERVLTDEAPPLLKRTMEALDKLPTVRKVPAPQLWKFEVWGSYPDFATLCERLAKSDEFVVPLSMSMAPIPKDAESPKDAQSIGPGRNSVRDRAREAAAQAGGVFKWTLAVWL
jgi:hypothetical protein